jgi:hypothetical protein
MECNKHEKGYEFERPGSFLRLEMLVVKGEKERKEGGGHENETWGLVDNL